MSLVALIEPLQPSMSVGSVAIASDFRPALLTATFRVTPELVLPPLSVTVSVTGYMPAVGNLIVACGVPSPVTLLVAAPPCRVAPTLHDQYATVPSGSEEALPSKLTAWPALGPVGGLLGVNVNAAV